VHSWRTVENSAAYLIPYLVPGTSLLDVGSGPGTITLDFAQRVAPGRVVGIDQQQDLVDRAAANAAEAGVDIEYRVGDIYALDFPDDTFDIVHAHQVMQYMVDPVAAFRELRRVTKPGGIVGVRDVDYGGVRWFPWVPEIEIWRDLYQQVARANQGEPDAGPQLKSWALEAGFASVETTATIWCFSTPEDREWWGGSWADRVVHSEFAAQAIRTGHATQAGLERIAAGWREWVEAPNGVFNMPHNEVIARK